MPSLAVEVNSLTCRADAVQKEPLQVILVDTDNRQLCINHDLIVRDLAAAAIPMSASEDGDSGTGTLTLQSQSTERFCVRFGAMITTERRLVKLTIG